MLIFFVGTFSQPSIRCDSQSPQPGTSRGSEVAYAHCKYEGPSNSGVPRDEEYCEDEDVYGESLPELGTVFGGRHRSRGQSLDDPYLLGKQSNQQRLSTSMGEVWVFTFKKSFNT